MVPTALTTLLLPLGCTFSGASADAVPKRDAPFIVEAEDFDNTVPGIDTQFEILSSQVGFSGRGYVEGIGTTNCLKPAQDACGAIEFDFEVLQLENFFLNLRLYAEGSGSNSIYWEIRPREGAPPPRYSSSQSPPFSIGIPDYKPEWQSYTKDVSAFLEAGRYTLVMRVRERGFKLDQVSLTLESPIR